MCGVIGILGPSNVHVVSALYDGLLAVQHRGQDAAGICTFDGQFHLVKGDGLVRDVFLPQSVDRLLGHIGVAQVRYPTIGGGGAEDAQPFLTLHPFGVAMAHNGQVFNFVELKRELETKSRRLVNSGCDVEIILHVFADELANAVPPGTTPTFEHVKLAVQGVHKRVRGAYSVIAVVAGIGLIAFRDPFGIRPLIVGHRKINGESCYFAASESIVLDFAGYTDLFNVKAGEVILADFKRTLHRAVLPTARTHRPCIFEHVYFARPDSVIDEVSVYAARVRLGAALAEGWRKTGKSVDVIVPVPDSARPAAMEMAARLNVRCQEGLVKNRYVGRTFIMPGNTDRGRAIRHKLNTVRAVFEGKTVLLVDDSIVRGNTIKQLIKMARDAGAAKVYFASYAAPLKFPCVYGIDMSTKRDFIARERSVDEICKEVGADFLLYQTIDEMIAATRNSDAQNVPEYCTACFTGTYATGDVPSDVLSHFETDRGKTVAPAATSSTK